MAANLVNKLPGGEVITECSIQTSDGVKVAEVVWASDEFIRQFAYETPYPNHLGTPVLHTKSFTRGKGLFVAEDYIPPKEPTDAEYPLLFTTGRHYARYNFSSMTGKTLEIDDIAPECLAEVNPAERHGMKEGDMLRLTSRRSQQGTIFTTYNYADTPVNFLTLDALDRLSRTPEYKLCAIKVEMVREC